MGTIEPLQQRKGILYPLLLIAAIVVIIFSVIGIAVMTGMLQGNVSSGDTTEKKSIQRDGKSAGVSTSLMLTKLMSDDSHCIHHVTEDDNQDACAARRGVVINQADTKGEHP